MVLRALIYQVRYGKIWVGRRAHDDENGMRMSKKWTSVTNVK